MIRYLFTIKNIDFIELSNIFYNEITLRFNISNRVILDHDFIFINTFELEVYF